MEKALQQNGIYTMERNKMWEHAYKRKRAGMMFSGAFAIFFTGYPHIWSVYQPYVMEQTGWTQSQTSLCFYLALAAFVFGNIFGGRIQDKGNPRISIVAGGGIFTAGVLLSSFLIISTPVPLYLTYGVLQGFGQGMIYTTIISTAQKWFRQRPGFASGIVVTANGLCGFFLAPISRALLKKGGPSFALLVVGAAVAVSWVLSSIFFCVPEDMEAAEKADPVQPGDKKEKADKISKVQPTPEPRQYTSAEMMRTKSFYFLLATMLFGLMPYFLLSPVSQSFQTAMGIPETAAVSAVMIGSIGNALMRLALPTISDKIGRTGCIRAVLVMAILAMGTLGIARSYAVTSAIIVMYGCYGGIMGSFPAFTSSIFGMEHSGENYGYVMFAIVLATIGAPILSGWMTSAGCSMQAVFAVGAVFAAAALVCQTCLGRELKKKKI